MSIHDFYPDRTNVFGAEPIELGGDIDKAYEAIVDASEGVGAPLGPVSDHVSRVLDTIYTKDQAIEIDLRAFEEDPEDVVVVIRTDRLASRNDAGDGQGIWQIHALDYGNPENGAVAWGVLQHYNGKEGQALSLILTDASHRTTDPDSLAKSDQLRVAKKALACLEDFPLDDGEGGQQPGTPGSALAGIMRAIRRRRPGKAA